MRGSQLDKRITIERKSVTQDPDYGTDVITWAAITNGTRVPAQFQDVLPSKAESTRDGLRVAILPARVRIRYRSDVTADMRVIFHGASDRTMQIVGGPAEIGRREWLEMVCEAYSS
jgi:SPP1 family predicted phage head-tail adaptor